MTICPHCGRLAAPLILDAEFHLARRGEIAVALGPMEFRALEAIVDARRPVYADWLRERAEAGTPNALHKAMQRLRVKLEALGFELVNTRAGAGEAGAYTLSDAPATPLARSAAA